MRTVDVPISSPEVIVRPDAISARQGGRERLNVGLRRGSPALRRPLIFHDFGTAQEFRP